MGKYGQSGTRTYSSWENMKQRCNNPRHVGWANYGGRGISYDPRWEVYENFLADMGRRPHGMTLDRIDNDGNYTRDNCRWATRAQQLSNTRRFKNIQALADAEGVSYTAMRKRLQRHGNVKGKRVTTTIEGKTAREWAEELGVSYHTIMWRLRTHDTVTGR